MLLKKIKILFIGFVLLFGNNCKATTFTVSSNQLWSAFSTTPTSADNIKVKGNATLTVDVANAVCKHIDRTSVV